MIILTNACSNSTAIYSLLKLQLPLIIFFFFPEYCSNHQLILSITLTKISLLYLLGLLAIVYRVYDLWAYDTTLCYDAFTTHE